MRKEECAALDRELPALYGLATRPIAIAFVHALEDAKRFQQVSA